MAMNNYQVPVTTTGSAGSASGTARIQITGYIHAIRVNYHGSAPATTTVDIDEDGGLGRKLMDLAASATDTIIYPIVQNTSNTGTPIADEYTRYFVPNTPVIITVALSDALTNAVVLTITTTDH